MNQSGTLWSCSAKCGRYFCHGPLGKRSTACVLKDPRIAGVLGSDNARLQLELITGGKGNYGDPTSCPNCIKVSIAISL